MSVSLRVGSCFTGVGGIDLGLERAGHHVVFQCEINEYRRRILTQHWPGVPCYADIREVAQEREHGGRRQMDGDAGRADAERERSRERASRDTAGSDVHGQRTRLRGGREPDSASPAREHGPVDLLCGGFPCQDLSVAGLRAGLLDGERSSLFFELARCADALLEPGGWLLVENVPGLLSSNDGRDFAVVLATLAELGFHDLAWRVLDSRHFGVPQRRRRVFVLARRAVGDRARAVLLEPEGGGGRFAEGPQAGTPAASSLTSGAHGTGVSPPGRRQEDDDNLIAGPLTRRYGKGINSTVDDGALVTDDGSSRFERGESYYVEDFENGTLTAETGRYDRKPLVAARALSGQERYDASVEGFVVGEANDPDGVRAAAGLPRRVDADIVDPPPDGPRYAAMGDAVTVNVAEWIGRRLAK